MISLQPYEWIDDSPWNTLLEDRLKRLSVYRKQGFLTAVYLSEHRDLQSTFRYRAYNMVQALYGSKKWKGVYFYQEELEMLGEHLTEIDCIILVRYKWEWKLNVFLERAAQKNISLIYDVDDYIFDIRALQSLLKAQGNDNPSEGEYLFWHDWVSRIEHSVELCDVCLTTNQYLADLLERILHKKCYVLKNFFNYWQYEASNHYYMQKKARVKEDKDIVLGYFSGSNTHKSDLNLALNDLKGAFQVYPNLKMNIVGYMELDGYMEKLKERGRIRMLPFQNFIDLQKCMAEVDINLIPLVNSTFANSKSELKFFEAGIVGTISCASPTYVYRECIQDGINGYLCEEDQWFTTISRLCEEGIEESVVEAARQYSIENYAYFNQVNKIEQVLDDVWGGSF